MKSIVVVDCASSGQMYVDDISRMGYHPVVIYTPIDAENAPAWSANIANVKKGLGDKADIFQLDDGYTLEDVLGILNPYEVALVLPGSDPGVRLADRLSEALGTRGNDPSTTHYRCNKQGMDEALTKANIRHIMTSEVRSEEEVAEFWNNHCSGKAVLKFTESAGTIGLKICSTLEECIDHFRAMAHLFTEFGVADNPVLMQEFIGGTEYIVNSVSLDGKHKITDIWRYEKIIEADGVIAYDTCILVDRLVPGMQELLNYDYAVLDAVEMKNGFCHTEIKIDQKGPVLIETNPRPMGANLTSQYLDEIFGYHMTDITLKTLLEPSFFLNFSRTPYIPRKSAMFKFSIVPRDVDADLAPFFEIVRHLESYREITYFGEMGTQHYPRTIDLGTSPFFIKMTHEDYGVLKRDYELLRQMEERYFDMVFTRDTEVAASSTRTDLEPIISSLPLARKFSLVTDDGDIVIQYGNRTRTDVWEVYDGVIFNKNGKTSLVERFRDLMKALNQVRKGGIVIITPESYENIPYGSVGAETIMVTMGFCPEIPPSTSNGIMYGIKR